jgi:Ca-activated chloride channel homolog
MTFAWPIALLSLLALPLLVLFYLSLVRARAARVEALAKQGFVPNAASQKLRRKRHVPFVLFLLGMATLLFSLARPQATVSTPRREGVVMLAFDVSNSMKATDLEPTRMEAAKVAAKAFVAKQPSTIQVGVVAFSEGAIVTQRPTKDKAVVTQAIDRLTVSGGTSLGQGIFGALSAIAGKPLSLGRADPGLGGSSDPGADPGADPGSPSGGFDPGSLDAGGLSAESLPDIGYFGNAAVVLLSDGENTSDPDPQLLAQLASTAGVKITTIGIGRPGETVLEIDGFQVATALDEEQLQGIAKVTDGSYFSADNAESLASVYKSIDLQWKRVPERLEITPLLAGAGALLLVLGSVLSLLWLGRLV